MADASTQKRIAELCWAASAGEAPEPRLAIYRKLVRGNLRAVARQMMPRTAELLGDAFERGLESFLAERGPRTHYLRDVPHELLAHAAPAWRREHAHAADLAAWELAHFAVSAAPKQPHAPPGDLALDRAVLFDDAARLLHLDHAVHEEVPAPRDVHLLVYRDEELEVRALELSPLAAEVTARLLAGEALGPAITASGPMSPETLDSIARLLADFGERGIVLGSAPEDAVPDPP